MGCLAGSMTFDCFHIDNPQPRQFVSEQVETLEGKRGLYPPMCIAMRAVKESPMMAVPRRLRNTNTAPPNGSS